MRTARRGPRGSGRGRAVPRFGSVFFCHWSKHQSRRRRDRLMTPTVAIIAPGNMGAGIGRRLTENKVPVVTSLAGRSDASTRRAHEAGMQSAEERALVEADFLLSIVP